MASVKQKSAYTVFPEKHSDGNILNSVVGFFNDYIPSSTGKQQDLDEERVIWAKFEHWDLGEFGDENENSEVPLILMLGTNHGLKIWTVATTGEGSLLYCQKGPYIHCAKLLPAPELCHNSIDYYATRRPIVALCEAITGGTNTVSSNFRTLRFLSLRSGEDLRHSIFSSSITSIDSNRRFFVVTRKDCLTILTLNDLLEKLTISCCRPSIERLSIPTAIGSRWLAFAADMTYHSHLSEGGDMSDDTSQPMATTVINVKNRLFSGLSGAVEFMTGVTASSAPSPTSVLAAASTTHRSRTVSLGGDYCPPTSTHSTATGVGGASGTTEGHKGPGIVTVVDAGALLAAVAARREAAASSEDMSGSGDENFTVDMTMLSSIEGSLVAHFQSHRWAPVARLQFDPSGVLLVTACIRGHAFNVFRISSHPLDCRQTAVHHLYTLHRGETPCQGRWTMKAVRDDDGNYQVVDMTVSRDSRWVSVSTCHGTSHLFPITPYGGEVTIRTHSQPRVVNRSSRYHNSAGIEEIDLLRPDPTRQTTSGLTPSSVGSRDSFSEGQLEEMCASLPVNRIFNTTNPRLPPYPRTCTVQSKHKIYQQLGWSHSLPVSPSNPYGGSGGGGGHISPSSPPSSLLTGGGGSAHSLTSMTTGGGSSTGGAESGGRRHSHNRKGGRNSSSGGGGPGLPLATKFASTRCFLPGGSVYASRDRDASKRAVDSLFVLTPAFEVIEYELRVTSESPQEAICQDDPISMESTGLGHWRLITPPGVDLHLPALSPGNALSHLAGTGATTAGHGDTSGAYSSLGSGGRSSYSSSLAGDESSANDQETWVSQVEITTHSAPHRRLWMGPQFAFKNYNQEDPPQQLAAFSSSCAAAEVSSSVAMEASCSPPSPLALQGSGSGTGSTECVATTTISNIGPRRVGGSGRSWNLSTGSTGSTDLMPPESATYIEAGSFHSSSLSGSLSSLAAETPGHDRLAQTLADAMLDDETNTTPVGLTSLQTPITPLPATSATAATRPYSRYHQSLPPSSALLPSSGGGGDDNDSVISEDSDFGLFPPTDVSPVLHRRRTTRDDDHF